MTMAIAAVVALTAVGIGLGAVVRRQLSAAGHRIDEEETHRRPRGTWVAAAAVPVLWVTLAWRLQEINDVGARLAPVLFLVVVGVMLSVIDVDVHRLPEGLTLPAAGAQLGLVTVTAGVTGRWTDLAWSAACGVGSWVVYLLLALTPGGGMGLGDGTFGALVGLTVGSLHPLAAIVAVIAAFATAAAWALVGLLTRRLARSTELPFGPFIFLGAIIAIGTVPEMVLT